ncbi:MAG: hypothetical protein KAH22_01805 [Thiotrichaceae bacterium]|nr:hypothetical protein [Thiotrichaceae bacterium]
MNSKAIVFAIIVLCLSTISSYAFEKDFPPYAKKSFPPICKIQPLNPKSETNRNQRQFKSSYILTRSKKESLTLHLDMSYQKNNSGVFARLKNSTGKEMIKVVKVGDHPSNIKKVMSAYLNKDNRKDFMIILDAGDGYLSGGRQYVSFLLSTPKGYSVQQLEVYTLGQEDFYDYSTDNKCEYLHQSFTSEGKESYWSFNILQFIDDKIVIKNQLSRYFPKWIKQTIRPNSKASTLNKQQIEILSSRYKKQLGSNIFK